MDDLVLSIILPVYNGEKTISRTLDSIVKQNFTYPYEVIIINDSTDNSLNEIIKYVDKLPLNLINVDLNVHCAGNSRQIGLECCKGEWITFIDQDDEFEDDAFINVFNIIEQNELKYICCTLLYEYNENTNEIVHHEDLRDNIDVWLHGKYYNRKNLIERYDIKFKKNLLYLEDLYFNLTVIDKLFEIGILNKSTYTYYNIDTYKWHEHGQGTHEKLIDNKYIFNHCGIAYNYCDIVFPIMLNMFSNVRNLESSNSIIKMTYSDIGYIYYNYNVLRVAYGENDSILTSLSDSFCRYLPDIISKMRINNIFDYVKSSIEFHQDLLMCTEEEKEELTKISFAEWWCNMLTKCSIIG